MPMPILMPVLSPTMTEGTLSRWLKAEGDPVAAGDAIAEIETDKATMEVEVVDDGVLGKIVIAEGTEGVAMNEVIALVLEDGEDPAGALANAEVASVPAVEDDEEPRPVPNQVPEDYLEGEHAPGQAPAAALPGPEPEVPAGTEMITQTVRESLRDAMAEEMRRDADVFLMGEEVAEYQGAYKVSQGLLAEFGPRRVIDTPITESGFAGIGVGAAYAGLKPIVEFMTFNFAMQAIDHIINSAAKTLYMSGGQMPVPIVFRGPNGAASRVAAQHSQNYASWYAHVPGLKVVAPYSGADAKGLLKSAIRDPGPVVFLEDEILYGQNFEVPKLDDFTVPIGRARIVREGADVTVLGYSIAVARALEAAEIVAADGIDVEIIDLRTLRPLDTETILASIRKTNRAVIVDEGWPFCGISSELSALLMESAFDDLDAPVARITGKDVPMPYAANLERLALPQSDEVAAAIRAVCYR